MLVHTTVHLDPGDKGSVFTMSRPRLKCISLMNVFISGKSSWAYWRLLSTPGIPVFRKMVSL